MNLQFKDGLIAFSAVVSLEWQPLSIPGLQWEAVWGLTLKLLKAEKSAKGCGYFGIQGLETTGSG